MTDLPALRHHLTGLRGRELWRSLEELAAGDALVDFVRAEAPRHADALLASLDRRRFLQLMGASLALGGLAACTRQPDEDIVPFVRQPEGMVLGKPKWFATAMPLGGFGVGLLAESHDGRPTKLEGNPRHPSSLGGTDALTQASVLGLYDPDRSQTVTSAGQIRTWDAFLQTVAQVRAAQRERGGRGLRFLTGTVTSPTLARQMRAVLEAYPGARWHQYEPAGTRDALRAGAQQAFGTIVDTRYQLDRATVVVGLDADVCGLGPGRLRYARDLARARRVSDAKKTMCRLWVAESSPTVTGSIADERLAIRSVDVESLARAVAVGLGVDVRPPGDAAVAERHRAWIDAVVADLRAAGASAAVIPGEGQPAVVHAIAHAVNQRLGAVGATVVHTAPIEPEPVDQTASLETLVDEMERGAVECLVILDQNPVYATPADVRFKARLERVPLRIHLGLYQDETAELCQWHVPAAHYLESWSDVRAHDGTASIVQPLIAPLYEGKTAHEVLGTFLDGPQRTPYDLVRETWNAASDDPAALERWHRMLIEGVVPDTAAAAAPVTVRAGWDAGPTPAFPQGELEVVLRPSPYVWDGAFANNGWLQELPQPLTKLVWDNAALVAPATAERLDVRSGEVVDLRAGKRTVRAPVWVTPGQAADSITLHLGYGRRKAGKVGDQVGVNAYPLRTAAAPDVARGVSVHPTSHEHVFACTQAHDRMEGRPLALMGTLEEWQHHPDFVHEHVHGPKPDDTLYPPHPYEGYAWGMAVDLGACIGCNACVAACVAENNIPVVGKDQVIRQREMHWLRIDRYYVGSVDDPEVRHQPVPCMQCENAPCETVCPVVATAHSSEGLNDMVYNRCVGTRYCSNNCPYKVRRFNFYLYQNWTSQTLDMQRNPDVTVRSRGVMEKCTYCVQRIEEARAAAIREGRPIRDGDIQTACQQACPTEVIVFGDVNDPESRVSVMKADPRNYALLAELNTRPRTTYLAGLRTPSPALTGDDEDAA
jgi:molybdopterin-containing oxidoreductase family iron-sulfur binding subunit